MSGKRLTLTLSPRVSRIMKLSARRFKRDRTNCWQLICLLTERECGTEATSKIVVQVPISDRE